MNEEGSSFSYFQKTVTLIDWWLIKADNDVEGKRLAVAGSVYGKGKAGRLFRSAPITQSYDALTLETSDGIFVILHGFINRERTGENGFPSEASSLFEFGFPPQWEDYAENCFEEVVNSAADFQSTPDTSKASLEGINLENVESKDCSLSNGDYMDDLSVSDFDHTSRTGAKVGCLTAPQKPKSKKEEDRNDGNNYRTRSRMKEKLKVMLLKEGGSSMKKSSRKISFDSHAISHIGKSKEKICILSPESLSPKRSRAGRLLLPTLHFWRNQIPLYDENRSIIGIQEEIKLDRGSTSEPQKKQKKNHQGVNLSLKRSK